MLITSLGAVECLIVMNQPEVTHRRMRILLLAGLVGINAFPFCTNGRSSYVTVFFALSAIHAELCLLVAWGIFAEKRQRHRRIVWCLMGAAAAFIAATRLLPGQWTNTSPWESLLLGVGATLPAVLPMMAVFATQRYCTGFELVPASATAEPFGRFRIKQLLILISGCAFLSLMLRLSIKSPDGWFADLGDVGACLLAIFQSFVMGLIAAPCTLVVLKPNRWAALWLVYFVAVVTVQPVLEQFFRSILERTVGPGANAWIWPESYFSVVIDNITWYGPQLLPTVVLFVLLRLSGVRVQETK